MRFGVFGIAFVFVLLPFAVTGCGDASDDGATNDAGDGDGDGDDDDDADDENVDCEVVDVEEVDGTQDNLLAKKIVVQTNASCSLSGRVTTDALSGYGPSDPEVSGPGTEHAFWFNGLIADTTFDYEFRVQATDSVIATGSFQTPALPANAPLPTEYNGTKSTTTDMWVAMTGVRFQPPEGVGGVLMVLDREGRPRLYTERLLPSDQRVVYMAYLDVTTGGRIITDDTVSIFASNPNGDMNELFPVELTEPYNIAMHHQLHMDDDLNGGLILLNELGPGVECDLTTATDFAVGDAVAEIDRRGKRDLALVRVRSSRRTAGRCDGPGPVLV
ncbi:MAG: hypothetical protein M5R36_09080 [Deltaproteobacteria bacterium]|nr:hypothetical protein [Deltaproteobacteria bacterium]